MRGRPGRDASGYFPAIDENDFLPVGRQFIGGRNAGDAGTDDDGVTCPIAI